MKPIGGFFDLEVPRRGNDPHPGALALHTGRACLMVILGHLQPARVFVPFHTCDATLEPLVQLGIPWSFYALAEDLSPQHELDLGRGEYILWTNYYGVCSRVSNKLKRTYGERLILDDTHAFFHKGHSKHWSFTSARKYFGVPDGAFLYGPLSLEVKAPRFRDYSLRHLVLRSLGCQEDAYKAYLAYEKSLNCEVARISEVSEALLRGVDYESVKLSRRTNFAWLHEQLGAKNAFPLAVDMSEVPFCYPYLPGRKLERSDLHSRGFFIPTLWPEERQRNAPGFTFERRLAEELLPLPIDHRYTSADLAGLVQYLEQT